MKVFTSKELTKHIEKEGKMIREEAIKNNNWIMLTFFNPRKPRNGFK